MTGAWLGTIHPQSNHTPMSLRLQLHLDLAKGTCSLDSLDQHAPGIPCTATVDGANLTVDIPSVHGSLKGTENADGKTIAATFTQGQSLELVLAREDAPIDPMTVGFDEARPALDHDLDKLKAVLDYDLTAELGAGGLLAPSTGIGVSIAISAKGVTKVFDYGAAKPGSVYEIGSLTKTFTATILAQMVAQKKVKLEDPVRSLVPKSAGLPAASGPEITLLDLSDQHSGLPRLPANLPTGETTDPYANYDAKALYDAVKTQGLAKPAKPELTYSNFGVGLLGQLLADKAGTSYEALLTKEITKPLGLGDTTITLSANQKGRLLAGHDGHEKEVPPWNFKALAGAGAIRSTAADMIVYLNAQIHPFVPKNSSPEIATINTAIKSTHEERAEAGKGEHIGLNWFRYDDTGSYWHNGATGGFSSYAEFNADRDYAIVVLCNRTLGRDSFADQLGHHIVQRLVGKPAITLAPETPSK